MAWTGHHIRLDDTTWRELAGMVGELGAIIDDGLYEASLKTGKQWKDLIRARFDIQDAWYTGTYFDSIDIQVRDFDDHIFLSVDLIPEGVEAEHVESYAETMEFGGGAGEEADYWAAFGINFEERLQKWGRAKGLNEAQVKRVAYKINRWGRRAHPILGNIFHVYQAMEGLEIGGAKEKALKHLQNNLRAVMRVDMASKAKAYVRTLKSGATIIQPRTVTGRFMHKVTKIN